MFNDVVQKTAKTSEATEVSENLTNKRFLFMKIKIYFVFIFV